MPTVLLALGSGGARGCGISRYRTAGYPPDVMVEIPIDSVGMLDFHKAQGQIDLGGTLTAKTLDRMKG